MDVHIDAKIGMMLVVAFLVGALVGGGAGAFVGHEGREHGDRDMRDMMDGRYVEEQGEGMHVEEKTPGRTIHNMMRNQVPPQSTASSSNSVPKESINHNTATSETNTGV